MSDIEVNAKYKKEAEQLINLLFDKRFLNDDLSKESIDWLEDFIGYLFESRISLAIKCHDLIAKTRDYK